VFGKRRIIIIIINECQCGANRLPRRLPGRNVTKEDLCCRSTRVARKKQVASVSVKEGAPTTSAVGGRQKSAGNLSTAKVGIASRAWTASKEVPRTVGRGHRSSSFDARSLVGDGFQGQQLAGGSSVETSLLEESQSLAAEDVDNSSQHRVSERASRVGELSNWRHQSTVGNKDRVRQSRSLTADNDARTC